MLLGGWIDYPLIIILVEEIDVPASTIGCPLKAAPVNLASVVIPENHLLAEIVFFLLLNHFEHHQRHQQFAQLLAARSCIHH